jgi:hypothetical protein
MEPIDLIKFYKSVYSEQGQDGVIEKIFECIGTTNKQFVEFGSSGMKMGKGNTPYLRENFGWSGLLIDGSQHPYGMENKKDYDVKIHFIKASTINSLFDKYQVPKGVDFVSIDIDGQDWHVWKALEYRPRVVSIETSWEMFGERDLVMKPNEEHIWDGSPFFGASILALQRLGNKKGYTLVSMAGADAIFVRSDILIEKGISFVNQDNAYNLWTSNCDIEGCPVISNIQESYTISGRFGTSSDFM